MDRLTTNNDRAERARRALAEYLPARIPVPTPDQWERAEAELRADLQHLSDRTGSWLAGGVTALYSDDLIHQAAGSGRWELVMSEPPADGSPQWWELTWYPDDPTCDPVEVSATDNHAEGLEWLADVLRRELDAARGVRP